MARYSVGDLLRDPVLRRVIGPACYAEIAMAAGNIWNPTTLEEAIHGRVPEWKKRWGTGQRVGRDISHRAAPPSSIYRAMRDAGQIPGKDTYERLHKDFKDNLGRDTPYGLGAWRHHPLWYVLQKSPLKQDAINLVLTQVRGDVARIVWIDPPEFGYEPGCLRWPFSASLLNELRAIRTIDSLMAATALTREAMNLHLALTDFAAAVTQMIFASVVASEPALYVAWPRLIRLFASRVWAPLSPQAKPANYFKLIREIRLQADLSRRAGIPLPPDSMLCKADKRRDAQREMSEAGDLAWTARVNLGSPPAFAGPISFEHEWQEILGDSEE